MPPSVHANTTVVVTHEGVPTVVREGDKYDRGDPLVAEFGWLFAEPVEQATAAPGEVRNVRRK